MIFIASLPLYFNEQISIGGLNPDRSPSEITYPRRKYIDDNPSDYVLLAMKSKKLSAAK